MTAFLHNNVCVCDVNVIGAIVIELNCGCLRNFNLWIELYANSSNKHVLGNSVQFG